MPKIIQQSISILSDAGLGMAMFSLGESSSYYSVFFPKLHFLCSFLRQSKVTQHTQSYGKFCNFSVEDPIVENGWYFLRFFWGDPLRYGPSDR